MTRPTTMPDIMAAAALMLPKKDLLKTREMTTTRAADTYEAILRARWGLEFSLERTKKVATTDARMPIPAMTRG